MTENPYDIAPYSSYAFDNTRPERLSIIAKLFGLETVEFSSAKVLELGCASGGNIIPLAELYPQSQFIGVDYSAKQITKGQNCIDELGLKNIELRLMSFSEIEPNFGPFDFIIAHGVYSWVTPELQNKLLEICANCLSQTGVAYVSYNTLPGWSTAKSVRDAMLYHTHGLSETNERVEQARSVVNFLIEGSAETDNAHTRALKEEQQTLAKSGDYYLLHEYLEADNNPIYFHQFMAQAQSVGLQFLAESTLNTMLLDSLPTPTAQALGALSDIVQVEQYLDFIHNRRFRTTLLCHQAETLNRTISAENFTQFLISSNLNCDDVLDADNLADGVALRFYSDQINVSYSDRLSKLIHKALLELNGVPISNPLLSNMVQQYDSSFTTQGIIEHLTQRFSLVKLVFLGAVQLHLSPAIYNTTLDEMPKASLLARFQSRTTTSITNCRHQQVNLDSFGCALLEKLNGRRSVANLVELLEADVRTGKIELSQLGGATFKNDEEMPSHLHALCLAELKNFLNLALLVP